MVHEVITEERPYNTAYDVANLDDIYMDDVQAHSQPRTYTPVLLHSETKGGSLSMKGDKEAGGSVFFL